MEQSGTSEVDLTILYGSQTGNAEYLAFGISEQAAKAGLTVELTSLNDALQEGNLAWKRLLLVTATHDNGHMPDNADAFWEWLQSCDEGQYRDLPYAVLAIGDSMYDDFCKAGQDFDRRFAALGAVPMLDRVDCDVDFDMTSTSWVKKLLETVPTVEPWTPHREVAVDPESQYGSAPEKWYEARVVGFRELTSPDSDKRVTHLDLAFDEEFPYDPGDSIDIRPMNDERLVSEWLASFPNTQQVRVGDETLPFVQALTERLELRLPHIGLINSLLETTRSSEFADRLRDMLDLGDRRAADAALRGYDVLDILRGFRVGEGELQRVIDMLRPLQARSYSIASSPRTDDRALSLTVSMIVYEFEGREHRGAGTAFLESTALNNGRVSVRRVAAHDFCLAENDAPIIMIGPGVGVAPFIGFLEHLELTGAKNDTWLFFGDRRRECDWLYRGRLEAWLESGVLDRLSLAFSRDQSEKHYVQHEIRAAAADIREWVQRGAGIYICGDKDRMAHDVEEALVEVLADHGGADEGRAKLDELRAAGLYAKDVY
jgi:sulfite reductase (NADPH) flavoprotein alpha-component